MIESFTAESFGQHVDSTFRLQGEAGPVDLQLASVTDLGSSPGHTQFSAVFIGPQESPARQGVYRLEHDRLGELELFLVPIQRDAAGLHYEAIFNRVAES